MRNSKEIFDLIENFALKNKRVRAVLLNGSRVNQKVTKDIFCDYDIVFAVTEQEYFTKNHNWINEFGELIIMQQNTCKENDVEWSTFLMLFSDGVRIDLTFHPVSALHIQLRDSLKLVLIDKDKILEEIEQPDESTYYIQKPTKKEFEKLSNEFWWCSTNIAKGLWREELCYAKYMQDVIVRECLIKMLNWYIGMRYHWEVNPGIYGKWLDKYLPDKYWESLKNTYVGSDYNELWKSLFELINLFRTVGKEVAHGLGYVYPEIEDQQVTRYLEQVRALPKDSKHIF